MYCPKCANPNGDDAKYCRVCGENLTVIAQAMSRHLPVTLVSKLDDYLGRKHERLRRDSIMTGLTSLFLLISGIWHLSSGGTWLPAVFMFVGALLLFMSSMWDMFAYKRSQSRNAQTVQLPPAAKTDGLLDTSPPQMISVTEQTTRQLEAVTHRSDNPD